MVPHVVEKSSKLQTCPQNLAETVADFRPTGNFTRSRRSNCWAKVLMGVRKWKESTGKRDREEFSTGKGGM